MAKDVRPHRLQEVLEKLAQEGISQAEVAAMVKVSRQFLNDVLSERRALSELLARRIEEKFGYDFAWILGQPVAPTRKRESVWLPVLPHPVEGDPRSHQRWDGTSIQVPAIAMATFDQALDPYVLKYQQPDVEQRLRRNDLVLISQTPDDTAPIVVALCGKRCYLARRKAQRWVRLANGAVLDRDTSVVGHCLGVLWSPLV